MTFLIALILGGVAATGFAPLHVWPLTLLCFAGLAALVMRAPRLWPAIGIGWAFGVGHFTIGNNWIATAFTYQAAMPHWLGWIAVVLLSLYLAVYPAMATGLAWRYGRSAALPFTLIFAAAWIITEWLRATLFTGFAWNPLGVIWLDMLPIARASGWIGTYGLSGLVILASGMLLLAFHRYWIASGSFFAAFLILFGLGMRVPDRSVATGVQLRVVQPNINQDEKYDEVSAARHFAVLARLSGSPRPAPRLVFWPEAATLDYLEEEFWSRARIAKLIGPRDLVLTGGDALIYDHDRTLIGARNSLFVVTPGARLIGRYDKSHLVPYGEYLPMRPILSLIGLNRLVPGDLDFRPGPGPRTLILPGFGKVGVQICYEMIFSGQVVDRADRPDFIFNPSNDAWFGSWGPPQHLAQARLRAVEEGLPVVRSTPTGISAVVDAEGRIVAALPWRKAGFIQAQLPPKRAPTFFGRWGNVLPFLFAGLLTIIAIAVRRKGRY